MREIKFRAFYKPNEKGKEWEETSVGMYDVVSLRWKEWMGEVDNAWLSESFKININLNNGAHLWVMPDEVYLMQYTGLKDKNGKEIYEGDIMTTKWNKTVEMIWDAKESCFTLKTPDNLVISDLDEMEIIGNIYENPELIKKNI